MATALYNGFESLMVSIGLGSPLARGALGAALFSVPILIHSSFIYTEAAEGVYIPKNWSLLERNDPESTAFPWYLWPIFGAVLFSLFL